MKRKKPSATARKVALNILSLGSKPGAAEVLPAGIVDATAELLIASGVVGARTVRFARSRWAVAIYEAFDWMLPGQYDAFAHRKAFCEQQVRDGLEGGATQVLVLGAGYDTLGWRLAPEFPEVRFFEIEHPVTAGRKAAGLEGMAPRPNLHLIPADLGQRNIIDVVSETELWDRHAASAIVAEGLLMYLPPEAPRELLSRCAQITGAGSRIAFTYVGTGDDGRPDVGAWTSLVLWLLKSSGEGWSWSIRPDHLPALLEQTGWRELAEYAGGAVKPGVEFFSAAIRSPS